MEHRSFLRGVADLAADYLDGVDERPVRATATVDDLRRALGGPLPDSGADAAAVVRELAAAADAGIVATAGPRFFGFVIGGALPAAVGADWLATAWDQNAGLSVASPAAGVVEEIAGTWLLDLLGLPPDASFGLVTGGQMANATALAAARHHVLARVGWDVERQGLAGAPRVRVLAGAHRHATIDRALRFLGLGTDCLEPLPVDGSARLRPEAVADALAGERGPVIVCTQVGEVNTGAVDPVGEIVDAADAQGAWVHVDGAFGLWAAAAPSLRHLLAGVERADSWATDGHKWLNVPYDCGLVFCAHPAAHRAAMGTRASYLVYSGDEGPREQMDWNPEFSRRARGFAVYAALRSLGRTGVADMIERTCAHARRFAEVLGADERVEVLNEVVLNQVLVRFRGAGADEVIARVQADGVAWMSGTVWEGAPAMRISVSSWKTTDDDVDRSTAAILAALSALDGGVGSTP